MHVWDGRIDVCIYLSVHISMYLPFLRLKFLITYLTVSLFVYLNISLSIYLAIYLSLHLSIYFRLSMHQMHKRSIKNLPVVVHILNDNDLVLSYTPDLLHERIRIVHMMKHTYNNGHFKVLVRKRDLAPVVEHDIG